MRNSSVFLLVFIVLFGLQCTLGQTTKKENRLLSRKRRYLVFPKGANFVFQWALNKPLLRKVPKGIQYSFEIDLPFPLPYDLTPFQYFKKKKHRIQRRDLLKTLQDGLDRYGLNGNACVKRILCDAEEYIEYRGKSLVKDLLAAIFAGEEIDRDDLNENGFGMFQDSCHNSTLAECPVPFLGILEGSLSNYS